jgi:hypothetical protein
MVKILILVVLMSSFFSYTMSPLPVSVQEDVRFTLYAIYSARDSANSFETLIQDFKGNISNEIKDISYNDINESKLWASKAEEYLDKKSYDDAKKSAYFAWFLAERASFRIYVNVTWTMIQKANETIKKIPNSVEGSSVAQNTLKKSVNKFKNWSIPIVFGVSGPSTHLKGYAVSMNYNKKPLYLDEDSAYQLARQAKEQALIQLNKQTNMRTQIEFSINEFFEEIPHGLFLIAMATLTISSIYVLTQKSKKKIK